MKNVFPTKKRSESREILAENQQSAGGASGTNTPYGAATPTTDGPRGIFSRATGGHWWTLQRRHYVALMAFFGFFNIYALRANLSIAILEMQKNYSILNNGTTLHIKGEFYYWKSFMGGIILSSFFYGYIITQIPGGWLASRHGGVRVYGLGLLATSLLTLLTPPLAHLGAPALIMVRVAEGLSEGVTYPAIHAIWRNWAPPLEKTKLATFAFAGSYIGNAVSMPLSAFLAEKFGWPTIFYFFGLVALFWCSLWFKSVREAPSEDPKITPEELAYIQRCIGYSPKQIQDLRPPWKAIFRSKAVWAIICAHFAENWGFYTMLTYLPSFIHYILNYKMEKTGIVSAIPYTVMGLVVIGGGWLADWLREQKHWETGFTRKIFCVSAFITQALFLVIFAHSSNPTMGVACITIAVGTGGLAWAGFSVNHLDIAPQYASILMGVTNTFATLPGMFAPLVVGSIVEDKTNVWEWRVVFYIVSSIYVLGAVAFWTLASGEVQPWADIPGGYASQLHEIDGSNEDSLSASSAGNKQSAAEQRIP